MSSDRPAASAEPTRRSGRSTSTTFDIVVTAVLAAVVAALGVVPPITVGVLGVPITLQTLGVMLAGALLGPVRGMLACLIVVVLAVAGLPILSGGRGGMGVLLGPTGGYLVGWIPGALVVGLGVKYVAMKLTQPLLRYVAVALACVLGGIVVVYAVGIPWTAVIAGVGVGKSALGSLVFVPGDLIKAVLASLIAVAVHRSYRRLL